MLIFVKRLPEAISTGLYINHKWGYTLGTYNWYNSGHQPVIYQCSPRSDQFFPVRASYWDDHGFFCATRMVSDDILQGKYREFYETQRHWFLII